MTQISPILSVNSIERSMAYYQDVLGFEAGMTLPGAGGQLFFGSVMHGDAAIMFGLTDPPHAEGSLRGVVIYLRIDDVDTVYARLRAAGAPISAALTDQFWGDRSFTVRDPDGYEISFAETVRRVTPAEMLAAVPA